MLYQEVKGLITICTLIFVFFYFYNVVYICFLFFAFVYISYLTPRYDF